MIKQFFTEFGNYTKFIVQFFRFAFRPPYEWRQVIKHMDSLGAMSLPLISIIGFSMGLILSLQTLPVLQQFGAGSFLPSMVSRSLVRELGPVITALIVAGRVSSGIGAEVGSMKVTEQIDALTCLGVSPFNYLVVTRVIACTLMMPILTCYADFLGICGGYLAEFLDHQATLAKFFGDVVSSLDYKDIFPGVLKTSFFGFIIGIVGSYKGFTAEEGTEGVGRATASAVVLSSLWIILVDLVLVKITVALFF